MVTYMLNLNDSSGLVITHTQSGAKSFCKSIGWRLNSFIKVDLGPLSGIGYLICDTSFNGHLRAPRYDEKAFRIFTWDSSFVKPKLKRQLADELHNISFFDKVRDSWIEQQYR
jgi:hypothetical protein